MKLFGERLKQLRIAKGIKQIDMAKLLDVTDRHYQRMEYGKVNVPALTLIALAEYFNVSLDYLVGLSDNPERR
ncbi:MAG: helix-turn-helix transcriptional regulator [Christensenellales bacterium]|nr:helix-turn-helix transcriptional regulator [Christensenellales bacterium]